MTYIALLRAVNVGGRIAKMELVRALFSELGLHNVRSYIQSGNIFFDSDERDPGTLAAALEGQLARGLGYEVTVFLRTVEGLQESLALDPFRDVEITADTRLSVLLTSRPLPPDLPLPHFSPKQDVEILALTAGEAFVVLRQTPGRPSNATAYIEKAFGVRATARLYATALKILAASKTMSN